MNEEPTWVSTLPTEEGYYWNEHKDAPLKISFMSGSLWVFENSAPRELIRRRIIRGGGLKLDDLNYHET